MTGAAGAPSRNTVLPRPAMGGPETKRIILIILDHIRFRMRHHKVVEKDPIRRVVVGLVAQTRRGTLFRIGKPIS